MSDYTREQAHEAMDFLDGHLRDDDAVEGFAVGGSEGDYRVLVLTSGEVDVPPYPAHVPAVPVEVTVTGKFELD